MDGDTRTFTATTTGVAKTAAGAASIASSAAPFATYAMSVKGTGGAASSWSVTLDGSLDGVNYTTILTHSATDGSTVWETTGKAANFVRVNVGSLTLGGSATAIVVVIVAVP